MKKASIENVIIIKNKTRLEGLTEKFNTQRQAKFYISQAQNNFLNKASFSKKKKIIGKDDLEEEEYQQDIDFSENNIASFDEYETEHNNFYRALEGIQKHLSKIIKIKVIDRSYLTNYLFTENDLVIVIGRDGLVANAAKYLNDIPIIGVNPDAARYDGVLLPFTPDDCVDAVERVLRNTYDYKNVTMAEAVLNDGQRLLAFNDIFIGPSTHVSARYKITYEGQTETHSSSGLIVSTGAGSTGWLSSMFNMVNGIGRTFSSQRNTPPPPPMKLKAPPIQQQQQVNDSLVNPQVFDWDTSKLLFVVREPFISKHSQANIVAGTINKTNELLIESTMPQSGVIFSDGIENDYLNFNSGTIAQIGIAPERAKLVIKGNSKK